ncbi:MAG: hypothetical protein JKY65_25895 [Planctomycetes bacterium]|nr:hypothetical protein [Planctomycetota bacterium]
MRPFIPLLLFSALLLVGCPQVSKISSAPSSPAPAKSVAKTVEAKTTETADPVAKKPQVTYFAFKG